LKNLNKNSSTDEISEHVPFLTIVHTYFKIPKTSTTCGIRTNPRSLWYTAKACRRLSVYEHCAFD